MKIAVLVNCLFIYLFILFYIYIYYYYYYYIFYFIDTKNTLHKNWVGQPKGHRKKQQIHENKPKNESTW
jgi:hypothetical protein